MNAPGMTIRPILDITGDHAFNEVFLDEVRLSSDALLGEVNDGWRLAKVTLGNERVSLSGEGVLWGRGPTANDLVTLVHDQGHPLQRWCVMSSCGAGRTGRFCDSCACASPRTRWQDEPQGRMRRCEKHSRTTTAKKS